ncbi:MAG: hypothetical protein QXX68_02440 [Candidatus Pacearchaeota archaeon]
MEIDLNLNLIRYLNILEEISKVRAINCFTFNNTIFFVVKKKDMKKAIGRNGNNVRRVSSIIKKRIRVLSNPVNEKERVVFIEKMLEPLVIEEIKIKDDELTIKAGLQERSIIIGRNRKGEKEMIGVLNQLFGIKKINFQK